MYLCRSHQSRGKSLFKALLGCTALLVLVLCGLALLPRRPEGRYRISGVAHSGISYFEFSNSVVILVSDWGSGASRKVLGSYHELGGKWFYVTKDSETNFLTASILSMKMTSFDESASERYPRISWRGWYFLFDLQD